MQISFADSDDDAALMKSAFNTTSTGITKPKPGTSGTIQCPICHHLFCVDAIEEHAETCSAWLIESDKPSELINDGEDLDVASALEVCDPTEMKKIWKEEITKVIGAWPSIELTRVTLRRKFLWEDFKSAWQTKFKPTSMLKVVFVGEPSVDDGGPKRELFAGKGLVVFNLQSGSFRQ